MVKSKSPPKKSISPLTVSAAVKAEKLAKAVEKAVAKALAKPKSDSKKRIISTFVPKKTKSVPKPRPVSAKPANSSTPKTAEDIVILRQILNIKIPEKFYSKPNMVLGDLVKQGDPTLLAGVTKAIYNAAANFVFGENTVVNTLLKILTLIVSNAIPYDSLKRYLVSKILKIIQTVKAGANFTFVEIYLKLFNKKLSPLAIFRNFSFVLVLPVIIGSFAFYSRTDSEESILKYVENAAKSFLSKNYTLFLTETPEITGETNVFLVKEKVVKEGENIVKLEKLGIFSPEIPSLNPKGIYIAYNPLSYSSKKPINLRLIADVPYLDISNKYLTGDISLIRTAGELETLKEKLTTLVKFYTENLESISLWYSNVLEIVQLVIKYDTFVRDFSYTIQDLKASNDPKKELKIKIYEDLGEDILTKEGIRGKSLADKYSLPEKAITKFLELRKIRESLLLSGINTKIKDHIEKVLEAAGTPSFIKAVRDNLNVINNTRSRLAQANRDIKSSTLKNINILSLRVDDTASVLSSVINKIKKYDTSNPVEFFKIVEPLVINTKGLYVPNTKKSPNVPGFKDRAQAARASLAKKEEEKEAARMAARAPTATSPSIDILTKY